jgi:hypothetical protein
MASLVAFASMIVAFALAAASIVIFSAVAVALMTTICLSKSACIFCCSATSLS